MRALRVLLGSLLPVLLFAGCGGDSPTAPAVASLAGTYRLAEFRWTVDTTTVEFVADGTTGDLRITPEGSTFGSIRVPPGLFEGGQPYQGDLFGIVRREGAVIRFSFLDGLLLDELRYAEEGAELVGRGVVQEIDMRARWVRVP